AGREVAAARALLDRRHTEVHVVDRAVALVEVGFLVDRVGRNLQVLDLDPERALAVILDDRRVTELQLGILVGRLGRAAHRAPLIRAVVRRAGLAGLRGLARLAGLALLGRLRSLAR